MARRELRRPARVLRARGDWYEFVRLGVTLAGGVAGVVLAMVAEFGQSGVIGAGVAGVAGGVLAGTIIAKRFFSEVVDPIRSAAAARDAGDRRLAAVLHNGAAVERLRDCDPYSIGVLRSSAADEHRNPGARRPPYIERSIDPALRESIAAVGVRGGVVVVAGHPKVGKSRTLFEALAASPVTRDRDLFALRPPDNTAGELTTRPLDALLDTPMDIAGPNAVLWIDDAHEHFPYGLTSARLDELLNRYPGLIVAMTVHSEQLQPPPRISSGGELSSVDRTLLDRLSELSRGQTLPATLTATEQEAARGEYAHLTETIEDPIDFEQLPSWFAGVDYLRRRYRQAGPALYGGVAVARAAINWRRGGMPAGINEAQLRQLAEIALDELRPGAAFTEGSYSYEGALEWAKGRDAASDPHWNGIALLRPVPGSKETLWRDFDAVTTWVVDGPDPDPPLSEATWNVIVDHVTPKTAIPVGTTAHDAKQTEIAIRAHRVARDDPRAMFNLGVLLKQRGGDGDLAEAEQRFRQAADLGDTHAMSNLGFLLSERGGDGDLAKAEQWYRRAADLGDAGAVTNLRVLLRKRGRAEGQH